MKYTASIASGASLSGAIDFGNANGSPEGPALGRLTAILMPATWDAANLTFQVSNDGVNFQNLYDDGGNEVTVTTAQGRNHGLRFDLCRVFRRWRWLKVRSGTSGAAVNQTADRSIVLLGDDMD